MAKIGRNDCCACGSGKKYKKCCLARDEAAALAARAVQPAVAPARLPSLASTFQEHDELDELTEASNAVVSHKTIVGGESIVVAQVRETLAPQDCKRRRAPCVHGKRRMRPVGQGRED